MEDEADCLGKSCSSPMPLSTGDETRPLCLWHPQDPPHSARPATRAVAAKLLGHHLSLWTHSLPDSFVDYGLQRGLTMRVCIPCPIAPSRSARRLAATPAPPGPIVVAASSSTHSPRGGRCSATVRSTLMNSQVAGSRYALTPLPESATSSARHTGLVSSPATRGSRGRAQT